MCLFSHSHSGPAAPQVAPFLPVAPLSAAWSSAAYGSYFPVSFGFYPASNLTHLTCKPRAAGTAEPITQNSSLFEPGSEQATLGSRASPDPATAGPKPSRHRPCHPVKEETLQQGPVGMKSLPRSPQKAAVELNQWASWLACSGELKIKLSVQTRCSNVMTLI